MHLKATTFLIFLVAILPQKIFGRLSCALPLLPEVFQTGKCLIPTLQYVGQPSFCTSPGSGRRSPCSLYEDLLHARTVDGTNPRPGGLFPPWVNLQLARKGQKFAKNNLHVIALSHFFGLVTLIYPDGMDLLMFTGASNSTENLEKRYMATAAQVLIWYDDCTWSNSNSTDFAASINGVRQRHLAAAAAARRKIATHPCGCMVSPTLHDDNPLTTVLSSAFFEDLEASNIPLSQRGLPPARWTNVTAVPVNQQIMALTQFAFVGFPILFPERLGMKSATKDDLWAFNHLWAVIGYSLGIQDKYNIALQPDLASVKAYYQRIYEDFQVPGMFHLTHTEKVFTEWTLIGVSHILGVFDRSMLKPNAALLLMCERVFDIACPRTKRALSPADLKSYNFFNNAIETALPPGGAAFLEYVQRSIGVTYFGSDFISRYCRARKAFFAYFE